MPGEFRASSLECIPSLLTRLALPSLFGRVDQAACCFAFSAEGLILSRHSFVARQGLMRCNLSWRGDPTMSTPAAPQSPASGPEYWQQAQTMWLSKIGAQLADIREFLGGILIATIVLVLLLLLGFAR
jgi:hypothetical protein